MRNGFIFFLVSLRFIAVATAQNCSINAGIDQSRCANETIFLEAFVAGPLSGSPNFSWTQIGGSSVTIVNSSSYKTLVRNFPRSGGTFRFVAGVDCQLGGRATDTVQIVIKATPNKPFAGRDTSFCPGTKQLNATAPASGETGAWTAFGMSYVGVGVNNPSLYNSTIQSYSKGHSGFYRWELKNTTTGCIDSDTVFITFCGGESVYAGPDQTASSCYVSPPTLHRIGTPFSIVSGSSPSNMGYFCGQQGLWTLVSKPSTAPNPNLSGVNDNMNFMVSNLYPGVYKFAWTVSGPCANGTDTMELTVPNPLGRAVLPLGNVSIYVCGNTNASLISGISVLQSKQRFISWTKIQGPTGDSIANPNSFNTTVHKLKVPSSIQFSNSFPYPYVYQVGFYDSVCNITTTRLVYVYIQPLPSLSFNSSVVNLPCNVATATTRFTYRNAAWGWTISRATGSPTGSSWSLTQIDSVTGQIVFSNLTHGKHTFTLRNNSGGCAATVSSDLVIHVSQNPTMSNAGSNQRLNCNVDSTTLVGNIPSVGTGGWFLVNGPTSVSFLPNNASNAVKVKNLASGAYTFRWVIDGGTCSSNFDDVLVTVAKGNPTYCEAGPNQSVCYGSPVRLRGSAPKSNETGTWSIFPTGPTFTSISDSAAIINNLAASTTYTVKWTIANACGSLIDSMTITTNSNAGPIAANAGSDACYSPSTTSITLTGNSPSPSGATGQWTAVGSFSGTITTPSSASTTVTGLVAGNYKFVYTISISGCASTTDTVNITIGSSASAANAGKDTSVCGTTLRLNARKPSIGIGEWSTKSGPSIATFTNRSDTNALVGNLVSGTYTFTFTVKNGVCPSSTDEVVVQISQPPSAAIAMNDTTFCRSGLVTSNMLALKANRPSTGSGRWSFLSGPLVYTVNPDTSTNPSALNLAYGGRFMFLWTVSNNSGNCQPKKDTVVVNNVISAHAGQDQNLCNQSATILTGNAYSQGVWRQIGNTPTVASISNINSWTASAGNLSNGTYLFEYAISLGTCTKRDTVRIVNYNTVSNINIGNDTLICLKDTNIIELKGPVATGGAKMQWSIFSFPFGYTPSFVGKTDTSNIALMRNANVRGEYLVRYTVSNGACFSEDIKSVKVYFGFVNPKIKDTAQCNGSDTFTLNSNSLVTNVNRWSLLSGNGSAPFSPDSIVTKVRVSKSQYQANYLHKSKNATTGCVFYDTATVIHTEAPVGIVLPNTRDTVCGNSYVPYKYLSTTNFAPGTVFSWTRNNTTNVTGMPNSGSGNVYGGQQISNNTGNIETVIFTITCNAGLVNNCTGNTFYDTLIVYPNTNYSLKLNADLTILCEGQPVKIWWNKISQAREYCLSTAPFCQGDIFYSGKDTSTVIIANPKHSEIFCTIFDSLGCASVATITFKIESANFSPKLDLSNNPICGRDSVFVTEYTSGAGEFTFSSGVYGTGEIYSTGKYSDFYYKPKKGESERMIYVLSGYQLKGCPGVDSILLKILPSAEHTIVADVDTVCAGDNFNFTVHFADPATFYYNSDILSTDQAWGNGNKIYNGPDTTFTVNSNDLLSFGFATGTSFSIYSLIKDNINGCIDTASTQITIAEIPMADAGPNIAVLNIWDSAQIGGFPSGACATCFGNLLYKWSPADSLNKDSIANPWTKTDSALTYTLTVTDSITGCSNTSSMSILAILSTNGFDFDLQWKNNHPKLSWAQNRESQILGYSIERSLTGNDFKKIANLSKAVQGKFEFVDSTIQKEIASIVYYRIECKTARNAFYSNVKSLSKKSLRNNKVWLSPNPAKEFTNVHYSGQAGNVKVELYNAAGKKIETMDWTVRAGNQSTRLNFNKNISSGLYHVKITLPDESITLIKLLKEQQ